jgi:hypothetical protein
VETYAFISNNSPRLLGIFKASMSRELEAAGKQFNVVDETDKQVTFTGFEAACLADAIVNKLRERTFRGEHLALHTCETYILS